MDRALVRHLIAFVTGTLLVVSGMVIDPGQVLAAAGCDQTNRMADLELTQTLTFSGYASNGDWIISKHAVSQNLGPCNIHDVTFTEYEPPTSTIISFSTNPSGWTCSYATPPPVLTCTSTASVGVPGFTDFYAVFQMPPPADPSTNVTVLSLVSVSGDVTDPNLANNLAASGVVGAFGGTVSTGDPTTTPCRNPFCQFEQVQMPGVGPTPRTINVREANSACTATGFGRCVFIDSGNTTDWQYKTFIINLQAATAAGVTYGQISLTHSKDLVNFADVPMCTNSQPDLDPCIVEFTKFKVGGATFVRIVARNKVDDGWGLDD